MSDPTHPRHEAPTRISQNRALHPRKGYRIPEDMTEQLAADLLLMLTEALRLTREHGSSVSSELASRTGVVLAVRRSRRRRAALHLVHAYGPVGHAAIAHALDVAPMHARCILDELAAVGLVALSSDRTTFTPTMTLTAAIAECPGRVPPTDVGWLPAVAKALAPLEAWDQWLHVHGELSPSTLARETGYAADRSEQEIHFPTPAPKSQPPATAGPFDPSRAGGPVGDAMRATVQGAREGFRSHYLGNFTRPIPFETPTPMKVASVADFAEQSAILANARHLVTDAEAEQKARDRALVRKLRQTFGAEPFSTLDVANELMPHAEAVEALGRLADRGLISSAPDTASGVIRYRVTTPDEFLSAVEHREGLKLARAEFGEGMDLGSIEIPQEKLDEAARIGRAQLLDSIRGVFGGKPFSYFEAASLVGFSPGGFRALVKLDFVEALPVNVGPGVANTFRLRREFVEPRESTRAPGDMTEAQAADVLAKAEAGAFSVASPGKLSPEADAVLGQLVECFDFAWFARDEARQLPGFSEVEFGQLLDVNAVEAEEVVRAIDAERISTRYRVSEAFLDLQANG